ncbi:hypothetical protein B0H11DRAFT_1998669 [Mycena galericulata]|nr:hypothetical protein B0H11DRAFT_1998669 [Mycena galericulata]
MPSALAVNCKRQFNSMVSLSSLIVIRAPARSILCFVLQFMPPPAPDFLSPKLVTMARPIPGRKSYKKTKERKEAIWPPLLETALVEALDKYRPSSYLGDTRLLRRFPKRNQFISDHILSVTGKRRTAKQVGSRLQQMRDTCADDRILNLLSRREYSPEGDSTMEPNTPSSSSLTTELTPSLTASSPVSSTSDITDAVNSDNWITPFTPPRTFVTIELISPPMHPRYGSAFPPLGTKSSRNNLHHISLEYPSEIADNDPLLIYSTPRMISTSQHYSHFRVLIDGVVAHSEVTQLAFVSTSSVDPIRHTYSTQLIPRFWRHLCRTTQLFQCVIEQDILKTQRLFDTVPFSPRANDESIRSVTYQFSLSRTTSPVFHSPPLRGDPSLPPEFPRVGYASARYYPIQPATKVTSDSSLALALESHHSSPPNKYMRNDEHAAYGWDLDSASGQARASDGLFSGISFAPSCPVDPSSYVFPYFSSSNSPDVQDPSVFAFGSLNQWPGGYDLRNVNISPTWSDAPMYTELNSDSY